MEVPSQVHHLPEPHLKRSVLLCQIDNENRLNDKITNAHDFFEEYRSRLPDSVLWTPLLFSRWLSKDKLHVFIKLETEQVTNSFKVRGALYRTHVAICEGAKGVVTASTGNHALAVVHAVTLSDVAGIVFLPENTTSGKVKALRASVKNTKAVIQFAGKDCLDAERKASQYAVEHSLVYISPYNDECVIAGQGTVGVEILETLSKLGVPFGNSFHRKCCYVTVGGGGLISGVAACLKLREPGVWRVVGCLPQNSPVMYDCAAAQQVIPSKCLPTLSDGSAGDIEPGSITLEYCCGLVDAWALISEADIEKAIAGAFTNHRKVVEGAAAVAIAGFQVDERWRQGKNVETAVVVACGSNIDPDVFADIIKKHE
ncbi:unnamed protein product [Chondrus crispus]|uniref:Tryptophan synthase beta chain-like PALP domain-containing protein n=1 Tax=Chondrus crispus TaxID=2769 RepID=R7QIC2_CHOCR|nr:unnamed protein product [Chondrus crispus]CDF37170.1 unnamed protein product [Chondrus crispus]|eukprot:XP_005716989.1 unnamed protein product [Chondrus crispus]